MEALYTAYLDGKLILSAEGEWVHEGTPFQNERLSDLFFRSIEWEAERNRYVLRIGKGIATFTCEDTAYFVLAFGPGWTAILSDGSSEPLSAGTLAAGRSSQIYCEVKGGHRARLSRAAHQTLLEHAVSDDQVEIQGKLYTIARR